MPTASNPAHFAGIALLLTFLTATNGSATAGMTDGQPSPGVFTSAACPCFSKAQLDKAMDNQDPYALFWERQADGVRDHWSLRGETWEQGWFYWKAPTVGFDAYSVEGAPTAFRCESWGDTWVASPIHAWAGTGWSDARQTTAAQYRACVRLLEDWIDKERVAVSYW
jgi:hypothetical protein